MIDYLGCYFVVPKKYSVHQSVVPKGFVLTRFLLEEEPLGEECSQGLCLEQRQSRIAESALIDMEQVVIVEVVGIVELDLGVLVNNHNPGIEEPVVLEEKVE
jgi:hypothetical protein